MGKNSWLIFVLVIFSSLTSWAEESLVQRLVSDDKLTRKAAFEELGRLDENSKRALVPPLIHHVHEGPGPSIGPGKSIRERAVGALSRMGRVVIPETIHLLDDVDPVVRVAALWILGKAAQPSYSPGIDPIGPIGPILPALKSALKKSLNDPEPSVRSATALALARLPYPHNRDALPDLIEALKDNDRGTRFEIAVSITQIDVGVEQIVPVFAEALKDDDKSVRMDAVEILSTLSDEVSASVKQVIPQLLEALQDSEVDVRVGVAKTLARFCGPENQNIVPLLIQALEKTDSRFERVAIVNALEQIGSPEALKAAKPYIQERNLLIRDMKNYFKER